ncbi:hypothetical protein [Salinibacter ruber]|uniref:hypothetical protein n=1 Tax=Salinibacter ruber TaxID=146919 RepID=UPI001F07A529|nr:hypothetical protein [Salinibacter ruber]
MNARRVLLGASLGVLLLAPAPAPESEGANAEQAPPGRGVSASAPCAVQRALSREAPSPVDRLRAAFALAEGPSSDTVAVAPPLNLEGPTLWLARAIYSETKLPHEQELVAWVVRNRVETAYRGRRTYRAVAGSLPV